MTSAFDRVPPGAVARLIDENPLAWIIAAADPALATPMPILAECDGTGAPVALLGHLPRAHPLVAALERAPSAVFLFQGPQGYVSPGCLEDRDWAPTWNFAVVTIEAHVALDEALTDEALIRLVTHMERGRPAPWTIDEMGDRYETLRSRVIGFRAAIAATHARFKLGQDEKPAVFSEILSGLGDGPLADWMRRVDPRG